MRLPLCCNRLHLFYNITSITTSQHVLILSIPRGTHLKGAFSPVAQNNSDILELWGRFDQIVVPYQKLGDVLSSRGQGDHKFIHPSVFQQLSWSGAQISQIPLRAHPGRTAETSRSLMFCGLSSSWTRATKTSPRKRLGQLGIPDQMLLSWWSRTSYIHFHSQSQNGNNNTDFLL